MSISLFVGLGLAALLALALAAGPGGARGVSLVLRVLLTLGLGALGAFCAFGFLATFEAPGVGALRVGFAALCVTCLGGIVALNWPARDRV